MVKTVMDPASITHYVFKGFIGNKIVFGPDNPKSQSLRDKVDALEGITNYATPKY